MEYLYLGDSVRRIIIKISILMSCVVLFVLFYFMLVNLCVDYKLNLVEVYVAARDINPRSKIREEDVASLKVPAIYVEDKAYKSKEEIINKYTDIQGKIPKGSLFYTSMLYDETELPDYPSTQLLDGQVAYSIAADMANVQLNTIVSGQRIDIYITLTKGLEIPVVDCLISNARVVSIRDNKGYDINHPKSNKTPYMMIVALSEESIEYMSKAEELGEIKIYASSKTYESNEAYINKNSILFDYLDK